jgi:DNA-binding NtrC family response regulator
LAGIAEDGEEAVKMFKLFLVKPKVILMDHRMPEKTGLEASEEILFLDKNVKIIFVSADISIREKALSIGAFSFWVKPFALDQLVDEVRRAIANYSLNDE